MGFNIGPICITSICVADDTYILSDCPRKLQAAIDIVGHYGKRYRVVFGADKTKAVITGSKIDMQYFKDVKMWTLFDDQINVTDENDHLGLIVSGCDEERKNIDKNIQSCRKSLFALLGPAFAYQCKLSPTVQAHLWQVYCQPILRSGLAALPIRPAHMEPLKMFQHSVLRGFLKLSKSSPVPAMFFLLGELPIEGRLHLDVMSLFWTIWDNSETTVKQVIKYILMMSTEKSLTWSVHLRLIFRKYNLPDPLSLLESEVWPKLKWKELTKTRVQAYHEQLLREKARQNSKMEYLNVELTGLTGRSHPILSGVNTAREVEKLRPAVKMLAGDYLTFARLSKDSGGEVSPHCRLCEGDPGLQPLSRDSCDTIEHVLCQCLATSEVRGRIMSDLVNAVQECYPDNRILSGCDDSTMTQFILDCSSANLPNDIRFNISDPNITRIFAFTRDLGFAIHSAQIIKLKELESR